MKRFLAIFLLISIVAALFTSCERNCYCKNLEDGSEGIMYGVYSKQECRETEDYYNDLYNKDIFECSYK